MSLLLPNSDFGWVRADAPDLDRKLREGDGIQWSGDPMLDLRQGVVEETRSGRPTGKIVARRWEVWRHCDDGVDRLIGVWLMEEFDRIIFDLARMKAESAGHEDVVDRIDKANAANDDKVWQPWRDSMGEAMEHMAKLWFDRNNPRQVFRQVGGMDERPDRNLGS